MRWTAVSLVASLTAYAAAFYAWYLVWGVVFLLLIFVPTTLDGYIWDFRIILLIWSVPALLLVFVPYWVGRKMSGSKGVGMVAASAGVLGWAAFYGYILLTQMPHPAIAP